MSDNHVIEGDSGTITVPAGTMVAIVTRAAESVGGIKVRRRGVDLRVGDGEARVSLDVSARYGSVLPEVGHGVQEAVAGTLDRLCGLRASVVDLNVEELE